MLTFALAVLFATLWLRARAEARRIHERLCWWREMGSLEAAHSRMWRERAERLLEEVRKLRGERT